MSALALVLSGDVRERDRSHYLREVISHTTGMAGLSATGEGDIRRALMRHFEPLLALSDNAVAALAEFEAIDRRLDVHVRTHLPCRRGRQCTVLADLKRDRDRQLRAYNRAFRALLEGRR